MSVMIEFTKWINEVYKNDMTMWYSKQIQNEYILLKESESRQTSVTAMMIM